MKTPTEFGKEIHKTDTMKKIMKLELLNYEGPVLTAYKRADIVMNSTGGISLLNLYTILDQWKTPVFIGRDEEFFKFINGLITVTDSKGKEWNFLEETKQAKVDPELLLHFITVNI